MLGRIKRFAEVGGIHKQECEVRKLEGEVRRPVGVLRRAAVMVTR